MKETLITVILLAIIWVIDLGYSYVDDNHQRRGVDTYLLLFFMMLSAIFFSKVYAHDWEYQHPLSKDHKNKCICYYDQELKFVPPGVPEEHINRDDSLSDVAIELIWNTTKEEAYWSKNLHLKKAKQYYNEAKDLCWYCPRISDREKAKMVFTSAMAAVPGPISVKFVASFLCLATQYGVNMIDEWFEIKFAMNMCNYHLRVVKQYDKYIKDQGW